ncbi:hypothetical protein ES708_34803 [subsurface metagenome]
MADIVVGGHEGGSGGRPPEAGAQTKRGGSFMRQGVTGDCGCFVGMGFVSRRIAAAVTPQADRQDGAVGRGCLCEPTRRDGGWRALFIIEEQGESQAR